MSPKRISSARHSQMRKYTYNTKQEIDILRGLSMELGAYHDPIYLRKLFGLLNKKLNHKKGSSVRIFFARKLYEYFLHEGASLSHLDEKVFTINIPFILEVVIIIQYLQNQIYDSKGGIYHLDQIQENIIVADRLKDLIVLYIDEAIEADCESKNLIRKRVLQIFSHVNDGQWLESKFNTFETYQNIEQLISEGRLVNQLPQRKQENVQEDLLTYRSVIETMVEYATPEKELFVDLYLYRIYLTNTALFTLGAELIGELMQVPDEKRDQVRKFTTAYGLALQITNDNKDFIYKVLGLEGDVDGHSTIAKKKYDTMSDLKNKNITLPLIFHLQRINQAKRRSEVWEILNWDGRCKYFEMHPVYLLKELIDSKAMINSIKISRKLVEECTGFLNPENEETKFLVDMANIGRWNKYYYAAEKFGKKFERDPRFFHKEMEYTISCELDRGRFRNQEKDYKKQGKVEIQLQLDLRYPEFQDPGQLQLSLFNENTKDEQIPKQKEKQVKINKAKEKIIGRRNKRVNKEKISEPELNFHPVPVPA